MLIFINMPNSRCGIVGAAVIVLTITVRGGQPLPYGNTIVFEDHE